MIGPDFDYWRKERERVLSKAFNDYREEVELGSYLAAIDVILEIESLIVNLRERKAATKVAEVIKIGLPGGTIEIG